MQTTSKETPDAVLVIRTRQGNANAFGELYDRYFDQLYRYIYFRVSDRQEAEDLTENVFLSTLEAILCKGSSIKNFRAWLFRSAHNIVVDHYRSYKRLVPLYEIGQLVEPSSESDPAIQNHVDGNLLRKAIGRLEPNMQQVISCRFIAGLSYPETAEIMGLKESHLRVLQHRALKQLKSYLSEDFDHHEQ